MLIYEFHIVKVTSNIHSGGLFQFSTEAGSWRLKSFPGMGLTTAQTCTIKEPDLTKRNDKLMDLQSVILAQGARAC